MFIAPRARGSIYIGPSGGDWDNPANWSDGVVPNGVGAIAEFASIEPFEVNMPTAVMLGTLVLNNQSSLLINAGPGAGIVNGPDEALSIAGAGNGSTVLSRGILHCAVIDGRNAPSSFSINGLVEGNGDPYHLGGIGNVTLAGGLHGTINVTGFGVMTILGAANSYDVASVDLLANQSLFLGPGVVLEVGELVVDGQSFPPGDYPFGDGTITVLQTSTCPPCKSPQFCIFDEIPNIAQGQATLFLNDECHLEVQNIGGTGQDGVTQSPLPSNSTKMVTGIGRPNFGASVVGTKAEFNMFADNKLLSTLTIENIEDGVLRATGDFSPTGATLYQVRLFLGNKLVGDFGPLPQAVALFPKNDLVEVDCGIEPQCEITYGLAEPRPVTVVGGDTVFADGLLYIALNPVGTHKAQTQIENFFTNTGTIVMTFQFAGPSTCGAPGAGGCVTPHASPGCDSLLCCGAVCNVDPSCCEVEWDADCANAATLLCANLPLCGNGLCEDGEDRANCPADCGTSIPTDIDGDGDVDAADLAQLLATWGQCPVPPGSCPADFDGSGNVGASDLAQLLATWG